MAGTAYDTDALIANVRRLTYAPSVASTGTLDADILAIANLELLSALVPKLVKAKEDYLETTADQAIVSGTAAYAIPTRATGAGLRDVWRVRTDNSLVYLPRLEIADLPRYLSVNSTTSGEPIGFYVLGNDLVLFPTPVAGLGSLRMVYRMRPSQLVVASTAAVQINVINTGTGVLTLGSNLPGTYSTTMACDFVKGSPHFDILGTDKLPTVATAGANSITFAVSSLPARLAVGDYVCLAGQTAVPQLPFELQPVLIQRTVCRVLEALGAASRLGPAAAKLTEMEDLAWSLLSPRIDGKPKVAVNRSFL